MLAAERVLELFNAVLGGQKADPDILAGLRREHAPESSYHEYKRGKWFDEHQGKGLRRQLSGFANAEGGVLILGIAGGEDSQGADKWTFEAPTRPAEGWDVWLGKALAEVAAKTRVNWQLFQVDGKDLLVIAANRAEELIRVYEKPNLVCHLRVGEHTHPIPETLFADLAIGRRAKPDLAVEQLEVENAGVDMNGFHVNVDLFIQNHGLLWVPDVSVAWAGYATRGTPASLSLGRRMDLRPTRRTDVAAVVASFRGWDRSIDTWMSAHNAKPIEVRPFERAKFVARIDLPAAHDSGSWAWYGAIVVVPKDSSPLWAQLVVHGNGVVTPIAKAWALPPGTAAVVAWFEGIDVPPNLEATFGPSVTE